MVRTPCCKAKGLKKGAWTPDEDRKLIDCIKNHGEGGWRTLPEHAGLKRCGKSCRLRWVNYLKPDIKRGSFSAYEEETIIKVHASCGNKWSTIAKKLSGRTDNEIKNHWNTHVKKRLIRTGIDPLNHKPRSENGSEKKYAQDTNKKEKTENLLTDKEKTENLETNKEKTCEAPQNQLTGSARILNNVATSSGLRLRQNLLNEIIEGCGGPDSIPNTLSWNLGFKDSDSSTSMNCSLAYSVDTILSNPNDSGKIFCNHSSTSASDNFAFGFPEDFSGTSNTTFMRNSTDVVLDDCYDVGIMSPTGRETKDFMDMVDNWNGYMDFEMNSLLDHPII